MELDIKIYKRLLTLLLGIGLFLVGFTNLMVDFTSPRTLSDSEIIERAKGLGLVEMKDVYKELDQKDTAPEDTKPSDTAPTDNQK